MELHNRDLMPYDGLLIGFTGERITPRGYIEVCATIGDQSLSKTIKATWIELGNLKWPMEANDLQPCYYNIVLEAKRT
ncbi:hypothetical protein Lal_00016962 [Lupinus albus]|nr:hypothetical protein Lal_00016962 [Lupinus albus]